jgi:hypothetical protein
MKIILKKTFSLEKLIEIIEKFSFVGTIAAMFLWFEKDFFKKIFILFYFKLIYF